MSETSPVLESIRRQSGGRIDTPPPIEVPNDRGPVEQGPVRTKKKTIEIEDDLADALRVVNSNLERILEGDGEIPDSAIPEMQKMGELQIRIVEAGSGPEAAGAPPGLPGEAPPPGAAPGGIEDLPLL